MASVVGLLILASAFFSHSFPMGGAEGWTLLDLVLPATLSVYAVLAIVHRTLSQRLRRVSLLPAALFFLMSLHIFTDPRIRRVTVPA